MRKNYEMSQEDLDTLLNACKYAPLIMLQCGMPPSPQERANNAWKAIGKKYHCDYLTIKPTGNGDRFFSAEPEKPHVKKDGSAWCAHWSDFINLQESEAAFGDTPEEAISKLVQS